MGACDYFRVEELDLRRIIKEIGRGKNAAGDLSREDAEALFSAMLGGRVPDLELGAILIALRVKGESLDELAGFMAACEASYQHLSVRGERNASGVESTNNIRVVIPSYNGARVLPNLVPLLALMLVREGIPVLIHGITRDPGRVTTCEVFDALGISPAVSLGEAQHELETQRIAFVPIEVLALGIARILALRAKLGVRNSTHTLAKMLQPFESKALRIVSVTHPDYLTRMREYFTRYDSGALLLRGAEGEAVAHPRREAAIDWAFGGKYETWTPASRPDAGTTNGSSSPGAAIPSELPTRDAQATARWIEAALAGRAPMPAPIVHEVECCKHALASLRETR